MYEYMRRLLLNLDGRVQPVRGLKVIGADVEVKVLPRQIIGHSPLQVEAPMERHLDLNQDRLTKIRMQRFDFVRRLRDGSAKATEVLELLETVSGKWMDGGTLFRWGLSTSSPSDSIGGGHYEVKRICLASDNLHDWKKNTYYASSSLHKNATSFWQVDFHTLLVQGVYVPNQEPGSPITSDVEEEVSSRPNAASVGLVRKPLHPVQDLERLDEFCKGRMDKYHKIVAPGYRRSSSASNDFVVQGHGVYCHSPDGECVRASLANALSVHSDAGRTVARQWLDKGSVAFLSLAVAGTWLEKNLKRYRLSNPSISRETSKVSLLMDQMDQRSGVLLDRVSGKDRLGEAVDHVVAVDAGNNLVLDPFEALALQKRDGVWDICVGDEFVFQELWNSRS